MNNNETRTATVYELHNQTLHLLLFGWDERMITWIWLELRIWLYCAHTIIQNIHRLPGAMKMLRQRERERWSYYELKQSLIVCEQTSTLRCTKHNHFKGKNSISFCVLPPFIFPKSLFSRSILHPLSFRFFSSAFVTLFVFSRLQGKNWLNDKIKFLQIKNTLIFLFYIFNESFELLLNFWVWVRPFFKPSPMLNDPLFAVSFCYKLKRRSPLALSKSLFHFSFFLFFDLNSFEERLHLHSISI